MSNPHHPYQGFGQMAAKYKNFIFLGFLVMVAVLSFFLLDSNTTSLPAQSDAEPANQSNEIQSDDPQAVLDTLSDEKQHASAEILLFAFSHLDTPLIWLFDFSDNTAPDLLILNPMNRKIIQKTTFHFDACRDENQIELSCLADAIGWVNQQIWLVKEDSNFIFMLHPTTGEILSNHDMLPQKYGSKAEGLTKLREFGLDDIEFFNRKGEEMSFFPYSGKMEKRGSSALDGRFSGSMKYFIINEKQGISDVFWLDAKIHSSEGTPYFALGYHQCQEYVENPGLNRNKLNQLKKLPISLINPIKVADNGRVAIFLHQAEFSDQSPPYAEAFDHTGKSLWKDSNEVFKLIQSSSNNVTFRYLPAYSDHQAIFFHQNGWFAAGIDFLSGKIIWEMKKEDFTDLIKNHKNVLAN